MDELMIRGDLQSMARQNSLARQLNCSITKRGIYPFIVGEKDIRLFLTAIFNRRTMGWDTYRSEMIEMHVCTEEAFKR